MVKEGGDKGNAEEERRREQEGWDKAHKSEADDASNRREREDAVWAATAPGPAEEWDQWALGRAACAASEEMKAKQKESEDQQAEDEKRKAAAEAYSVELRSIDATTVAEAERLPQAEENRLGQQSEVQLHELEGRLRQLIFP